MVRQMATKTVSTGITRFDQENHSSGFMVRICRNGKHINEFFSDSRYGTMTKARRAAEERYAELLEEFGPANMSMKGKLTKRNTSGLVGIHVARGVDNRWPDCEYWAYCASWVNEDRSRGKISFSWNKYGERDALELATLARQHEITDREKLVSMLARRKAAAKKRKAAKRAPGKTSSGRK